MFKIYVGNISYKTADRTLEKLFSTYGGCSPRSAATTSPPQSAEMRRDVLRDFYSEPRAFK